MQSAFRFSRHQIFKVSHVKHSDTVEKCNNNLDCLNSIVSCNDVFLLEIKVVPCLRFIIIHLPGSHEFKSLYFNLYLDRFKVC